jgi:hypothetical protein
VVFVQILEWTWITISGQSSFSPPLIHLLYEPSAAAGRLVFARRDQSSAGEPSQGECSYSGQEWIEASFPSGREVCHGVSSV